MNYRERYLSKNEEMCSVCGSEDDIKVHHIDGDRANNNLRNLTTLCVGCHGKVHNSLEPDAQVAELQDELSSPPQENDDMHPTSIRLKAKEIDTIDSEAKERGFSNRAGYLRWVIKNRPKVDKTTAELDEEIDNLQERIERLEQRL